MLKNLLRSPSSSSPFITQSIDVPKPGIKTIKKAIITNSRNLLKN